MATTQMNVRIDEVLKLAGDTVLASEGLSASDAVRATWGYLAAHGEAPYFIKAALENPELDANAFLRDQKLRSHERAMRLVPEFRKRFGIAAPDELQTIDIDALKLEYFRDRSAERGLGYAL